MVPSIGSQKYPLWSHKQPTLRRFKAPRGTVAWLEQRYFRTYGADVQVGSDCPELPVPNDTTYDFDRLMLLAAAQGGRRLRISAIRTLIRTCFSPTHSHFRTSIKVHRRTNADPVSSLACA